MAESRRKFDQDFKEGAVRLVRETGRSIVNRPGESGDSTLMETTLPHCRYNCNSRFPPISLVECRHSTRRAACC